MNIKKVIAEEIRKVIKEGFVLNDDNFKFRQRLANSSFYNYSGFSNDSDIDILESDIIISWHVSFWLNDSGIENFAIEVDKVEGSYMVSFINKQTGETDQETNKNIAETEWKFVVQDTALHLGKTLYVEDLEFDFKTKVCEVRFYDYEYNY